MARNGIGVKRRREVEKVSQSSGRAYSSNNTRRRGSKYDTGDYTLSKTKGYDKVNKENKERRGRKKKK